MHVHSTNPTDAKGIMIAPPKEVGIENSSFNCFNPNK